jgi:hypothetical protein
MKKFIVAIILALAIGTWYLPSPTQAQCNGIFPANTICGSIPGGLPKPTSPSVFSNSAGGTNGQIQYNASGGFGGFTLNGDCTVASATGVITCTKTNGVGYASSATINTTNASNITTGLLASSLISLPAGVPTNTLASQTLPFTITNSNTPCGTTTLVAGGPGTLTLSAVSGFSGTCVVQVCNTATNNGSFNGITLSGFPVPTLPHLWPQQCEEVSIISGAWQVTKFPGKFRPGFSPICFADTGGSNTNDGLVSAASTTAVKDPQQCIVTWNLEFDLYTYQPTIQLTTSQTNTQNGGAGNLNLLGAQVKVVNVAGSSTTIQTANSAIVAEVQDFGGYFIFSGITLDCTSAASHPCINLFHHQQGGSDLNGVFFKGANASDIAIQCDSFCKINGNSLVGVAGTYFNVFNGNLNSVFVFSNGLITASPTTIGNDLFLMSGGSQLNFSGALTSGGGTSVGEIIGLRANSNGCIALGTVTGTFTGARQWSVLGGSILSNTTTNAVPGSSGIVSSAGFATGIAIGTSGGC